MALDPDTLAQRTRTKGVIVTPDGRAATLPTTLLTGEEARLLRTYKKFLRRHDLKEALYCNLCWEHNLQHGCEAYVTDQQIVIRCRCGMRFFEGVTA